MQLLTWPALVSDCRTVMVENNLQALLVRQLSVTNGPTALQQKISKLKDFMVFSFFWKANLVRERHIRKCNSHRLSELIRQPVVLPGLTLRHVSRVH